MWYTLHNLLNRCYWESTINHKEKHWIAISLKLISLEPHTKILDINYIPNLLKYLTFCSRGNHVREVKSTCRRQNLIGHLIKSQNLHRCINYHAIFLSLLLLDITANCNIFRKYFKVFDFFLQQAVTSASLKVWNFKFLRGNIF